MNQSDLNGNCVSFIKHLIDKVYSLIDVGFLYILGVGFL